MRSVIARDNASMTYPVGKLSFDAKKANAAFFTGAGQLWIQPFWGDPFLVDADGARTPSGQPTRSHVCWGDAERVVFRSHEVLEEGGGVVDVVSLVTSTLSGVRVGEPLVVARLAQGTGSVRHLACDGRHAAVLEERGGTTVLSLWSIERAARVAEHVLSEADHAALAVAVTAEAARVIVGQSLVSHPFDGSAAKVSALGGLGRAFEPMGGAVRLPCTPAGEVLLQGFDGSLSLVGPNGVVFQHTSGDGYAARSSRASVASVSPRGSLVVAAVGSEATSGVPAIEVFDRSGALVRRLEWKCGKSETVYDVAIDDAGWIALASTHRAEIFAPEGHVAKKPKKKA